ncbi:predicted protein [Chaetomium globosum CBS 148.51]|uniref:Uncharacterized protein n=1 Tax=Chaetomium globosum (strain ATCC 6205 / CBS 148.51 / DSM 1962 / NBRC 6347 / NRRL 1970) TaxID=306901 RepID=Q2H341_CHAGB|nr:uncharacterized protein CHGG_03805 [Chaetomium globosum CBS 148.51]EAQ87186.1 predicted protein [Chaetomium globosum CBS 148.51]
MCRLFACLSPVAALVRIRACQQPSAELADVLPTPLNIANRVPLLGSCAAPRPPLSLGEHVFGYTTHQMQRSSHLPLYRGLKLQPNSNVTSEPDHGQGKACYVRNSAEVANVKGLARSPP